MPKRIKHTYRTDTNQAEIVRQLRQIGASVVTLQEVGHGCPDALIGFRGENYLFEFKYGNGKLTADETKFFYEWRGQKAIVRNFDEAMAVLVGDGSAGKPQRIPFVGVLHCPKCGSNRGEWKNGHPHCLDCGYTEPDTIVSNVVPTTAPAQDGDTERCPKCDSASIEALSKTARHCRTCDIQWKA